MLNSFTAPKPAFCVTSRERAISIVVKEVRLAIRGDEKILVAIVVEIADGYADSVHFDIKARFVRDIGERSIVIVVIKLRRAVFLHVPGPVAAIHQENIRPTVVVVVNESHAWPNGLRQEFFAKRSVVMNKTNSGFRRDVLERDAGFAALRTRCASKRK